MIKFEDVSSVTTEEYFKNGGEFSINVWKTKYPINKLERDYPAYLFKRVADVAASYEVTTELRTYWANRWFDEMWRGLWRPAGSILSALGSDKKISISNCTTIEIKEDSLESIFETAYKVAKAAAYRQGLGVDFSTLRPNGSQLNNSARVSSGSLNWMSFIDNIGNHVGQNSRIPAMLISINIKHPDVVKFLTLKSNLHAIQNANISVQITDDFMKAYEDGGMWKMAFDVKDTGEYIEAEIPAADLMAALAKEAHAYAEPGIQLIDTCKRESVSDVFGFPVKSTNAPVVGESPVLTEHGVFSIEELYNKNTEVNVKFWETDKWVPATFKKFPNQQVWEIVLENGTILKCNGEHAWLTEKGMVPTNELTRKDSVKLYSKPGYCKIVNIFESSKFVDMYCAVVPNYHSFVIDDVVSSNCSEKYMYPDSTCVLASVNAAMFYDPVVNFDITELKNTGISVTRFLDNTVTYELVENKSPFPNQKYVVSQLREIGIGVTNLHGLLLECGHGYDTDGGITIIINFIKTLSAASWQASIDLGAEKGNAPAFDALKNKLSEEDFNTTIRQSGFLARMIDEFKIKFTSLRNINVMSIAPTGSISLTFPEEVESSGIEPLVAFYYWKRTRISGVWQWYFVIPNIVRKKLIAEGYTDVPTSIGDNDGKIGQHWISIINKYFDPNIFKPAHHIDPLKKVEMMSKVAKYIDSSISVTYNLKEDVTPEEVEQIYYQAWKQGIKSVSVYRDKSRQGVIEFVPPQEVEKRFVKNAIDDRPDTIQVHAAAKRTKETPCDIYHIMTKGTKYTILIGTLEGIPYELFAMKTDHIMELDKSIKKGIISKVGKGKYNLKIDKQQFKDLDNIINDVDIADFTRMISTMLRHGIPIDFIVEQLEKSKSDIASLGKAIARVLKNYVGEYYKSGIGKTCSNCSSTNLEYREGCFYCIDCGSSKCG